MQQSKVPKLGIPPLPWAPLGVSPGPWLPGPWVGPLDPWVGPWTLRCWEHWHTRMMRKHLEAHFTGNPFQSKIYVTYCTLGAKRVHCCTKCANAGLDETLSSLSLLHLCLRCCLRCVWVVCLRFVWGLFEMCWSLSGKRLFLYWK